MSTKTTFKRIALVAVAALGLGTMSVVPATAATSANATDTAPTTIDLLASEVGAGALGKYVGAVQIDLSSLDSALSTSADSASVTITANSSAAKDVAFAAALSLSLTVQATTTVAANSALNAVSGSGSATADGYNRANNGVVTVGGLQTTLLPYAAAGLASGRSWLNLDPTTLSTTSDGAKVKYTLTVAGAGVVRTLVSTLTLTVGTKAGTATTPVTTGTVAAGGTVTATHTQPYTNVAAGATVSPTAFAITDTIAAANGEPTFSVAAVVTGGTATMVRTNATTITPTLLKNALTGSMSVTYTISVTVPATAAAGETVSVYGWTWTVQPYTPTYNSSTVSIVASTNGYRVAATAGGDGILWAPAADVTNAFATVTVAQFDQNGAAITAPAYARTVNATITGKGSLAVLAGADVVVKSQTQSVANGLVDGSDTFSVYSDGTSGEGTLTISVGDVAVQTYKIRFYGDAASITATLIRPIGSTSAATNGVDGTPTTTRTNTLVTTKDVTEDSAPAIAVSVKDANGWTIPTAAPTVTSSNRAVVASAARLFIDSGVSVPSASAYSAGTFVQHFSYTTVANTSGSTSDLTFSVVNAAGTSLTTTPVKVTTGGALASGKIAFDKATYQPGEIVTLTATGLDSAGNKAVDGSDLRDSFTSSLSITWSTASTLELVDGTRTRTLYAPMASGTWTLTVYDAADRTYVATATITNVAAEAKAAGEAATAAGEAATAAAEAATDAAAEATDAANAATDAANAAAEAADAATAAAQDSADAVAALSTQVSEMVAALKKQITALTNLVIKIQKKVKA